MNIQIGDDIYTAQNEELKAALARAHAEKVRPVCLCSDKRPELYIANINDGYFVKRMPGTGELHDADCDHFELDPMLSGRGAFESGAIVHDQDTNTTMLKLGFSLSQKIGGSVTVDREETAGKREYGVLGIFPRKRTKTAGARVIPGLPEGVTSHFLTVLEYFG